MEEDLSKKFEEKTVVTPVTEEDSGFTATKEEDSALPTNQEAGLSHKCAHCEKCFRKLYRLSRHIFTEHIKPTCTACNASFNRMKQLKEHARDSHDLKMNKLCPVCKKAFTKRNDLEDHFQMEHTKERMHQCAKCSRRFSNEDGLKLHVLKHKKPNPFPCFDCSLSFAAPYQLEKHRRDIHATAKTIKCPNCGIDFAADADLLKRICELHSEAPPADKAYKCKYCEECFPFLKKMNAHIRANHAEKRPFKCDTCIFIFETVEELNKHAVRHEGNNEFSCDLCERHFRFYKVFRNHRMRIHGEFPRKQSQKVENLNNEDVQITLVETVPATQNLEKIPETVDGQEE